MNSYLQVLTRTYKHKKKGDTNKRKRFNKSLPKYKRFNK